MKNELKTQCTIVIAKMCLFFLVYFLLVAYGGIFIYAASHFFVNYCMPHIQDSYETENYENLIIFIIITIVSCGFLLLYGLYPLKFIFGKSGKAGDSRIETTKEENPRLFKLIKEVADATGNKMPKHVFLSQEINACVFYDNTLRSLLFPTRKNLMIGLGLCANTNTEEVKSIIAHEFGHFAQNTMQIGSIIYFLNSVIYDMAFQYDKWDYLLAKYFKILTSFFRMIPYCGIIICLLLYLLYSILDLTKKVLRWTYKFVNKSYYSLSRQMEFDADEVACNFVGKENFISALIKIEFCSTCNSNATTAWKRLIDEGKYAPFFDVLELFEKYKAQEQEVVFSYNTTLTNAEDLEEYHSEISYINVFSDHPSTEERIKAVEKMQASEQQKLLPAWCLFERVTIEKLEKLYSTSIDGIKNNDLQFIKGKELADWIKQDFEGACLPKKYRPFFEEIITFDINDIKLEEYESYPFSEENRDLIKKLVGARNDRDTMLDLNNQNDIKYAIYKGVRYEVKKMPLNEQMKHVKELTTACQCISIEVFAYLCNNSPNDRNTIKNMYSFLFEGYQAVNYIDNLDDDIERMRNVYMNQDSDELEDVRIDFGSFERKFKPLLQECNEFIFPLCLEMGADKKIIDELQKTANSPVPDYTQYPIKDVIEIINSSIQAKQNLRALLIEMIINIKKKLYNEAVAIEENKNTLH